MSTQAKPQAPAAMSELSGVIISSDSHVMEPHDLWVERLPAEFRAAAPQFPPPKVGDGFQFHPGGQDPRARVQEMAVDGVCAEVLYPSLGLTLFGLDDAALQEACFRLYNDWLIEYCQVAPHQLLGIACLAAYDIDHAVQELERCHKAGLRGALVWQSPHPDLPFTGPHYDRLWAAAQEMDMPISLHILTGHNYSKFPEARKGAELYRGSVNLKLHEAAGGLFDFIFYGVLDRFPRLKLVLVENEIGWLPFYFQQWDYYYHRHTKLAPVSLQLDPSGYFKRQVYASFFNDTVGGRCLEWWGQDNCMWSNDFPHGNSTWPNSLDVIARDLGHVPQEAVIKLVRDNVVRLYGIDLDRLG